MKRLRSLRRPLPSIRSRSNRIPGRGNIVFFPQIGSNAVNVDLHTADPSLRSTFGAGAAQVQNGSGGAYANGSLPAPIIQAAQFDLPDLSTPYILLAAPDNLDPIRQAGWLSDSIATNAIRNEYFTDPTVGAVTDWTFTMRYPSLPRGGLTTAQQRRFVRTRTTWARGRGSTSTRRTPRLVRTRRSAS